ncbi:MAG: DUF6443 domain-containing protein [Bacteroidota bacterium]
MKTVLGSIALVIMLSVTTQAYCLGDDEIKFTGCSIQAIETDVSTVDQYDLVTFALVECSSNVLTWEVDCEQSFTPNGNSITIYFDMQCFTTIKATLVDGTVKTKTITVNHVDPLNPGHITTGLTYQIINYNWTNTTITCTAPSNGTDFTYEWFYSTTSATTGFITAGVYTASFPATNFTVKTYLKRRVKSGPIQTDETDVATVDVYPQLFSGTASSAQSINYNTVPSQLSVTAATGGKPDDHTYTWQSATSSSGPFTSTGSTGLTYTPSALTSSTYYRVETNSNGALVYSNVLFVNVYPQIQGGTVSPSSKNIAYNKSPGPLTASGISGGTGSGYTYQWQSSTDNSTWSDVSGETNLTIVVGNLIVPANYFRLMVTNNGASRAGSSSSITVNPQLYVGSVSGGGQHIATNTMAGGLFDDNVSGGSGAYRYQWQWSYDTASWNNGGGNLPSYLPGVLTVTTFFRMCVTSNAATACSYSVKIYVGDDAPCNCSALDPGYIVTPSQVIQPGMVADTIFAAPAVGAASYSYQWQKSTDGGVTFSNTSVTTSYYPAASLTTTTVFRRLVVDELNRSGKTCNTTVIVKDHLSSPYLYIRTRTIKAKGVGTKIAADALNDDDVIQVTQYYDGLGRPMQNVTMHGSPDDNDMVSIQSYDQYGRESFHYMPFAANSDDGIIKTTPFADQFTFNQAQFANESVFKATTFFENSPLNRPIANRSVGLAWTNHNTTQQYLFNTSSDNVKILTVIANIPVDNGTYAAGELTKTISTDEQSHMVVEFKDKDGHVVLKRVQANTPTDVPIAWASTYYIYDDNGNLVSVLPPEGVKEFLHD